VDAARLNRCVLAHSQPPKGTAKLAAPTPSAPTACRSLWRQAHTSVPNAAREGAQDSCRFVDLTIGLMDVAAGELADAEEQRDTITETARSRSGAFPRLDSPTTGAK